MATTAIWRVKGYLNKVLLYTENPEKTVDPKALDVPSGQNIASLEDVISYTARENATEQRRFVSGINCTPQNAREVMMRTKSDFKKLDGTIAYHGYQSFKEGEVTPEQAHYIGKLLAEELWGNRHEVIVATHVDKESHIHNHFVVNTVSFVDGIKYHRTEADYQRMREVSDRLCREYGLSVVRHPESKKKDYSEWDADRNGRPTVRSLIRADIDRAIRAALTEEEFYETLEEMGYSIQFTYDNGSVRKHPVLSPPGSKKNFRFDKLGEDYGLDEISDRILENIRRKDPFPEEQENAARHYRHEHPPRTKASGLARLYYYYCYELHIIVRYPASVKRVPYFMRQDLLKLDKLDNQTRFLGEHGIEKETDLERFKIEAAAEVDRFKEERNVLRNRLKRISREGDAEAVLAVKLEIAALTERIEKLRKDMGTADAVLSRAGQLRAEYEALRKTADDREDYPETDNEQSKEEITDEQLFGRSGGTGREDEPQRR